MGADEIPLRGSRSKSQQGISPQSAQAVCPDFYGIEKEIAKLADILGHSSIDTTRIYIMTAGTEHRRKIERLGLVV